MSSTFCCSKIQNVFIADASDYSGRIKLILTMVDLNFSTDIVDLIIQNMHASNNVVSTYFFYD